MNISNTFFKSISVKAVARPNLPAPTDLENPVVAVKITVAGKSGEAVFTTGDFEYNPKRRVFDATIAECISSTLPASAIFSDGAVSKYCSVRYVLADNTDSEKPVKVTLTTVTGESIQLVDESLFSEGGCHFKMYETIFIGDTNNVKYTCFSEKEHDLKHSVSPYPRDKRQVKIIPVHTYLSLPPTHELDTSALIYIGKDLCKSGNHNDVYTQPHLVPYALYKLRCQHDDFVRDNHTTETKPLDWYYPLCSLNEIAARIRYAAQNELYRDEYTSTAAFFYAIDNCVYDSISVAIEMTHTDRLGDLEILMERLAIAKLFNIKIPESWGVEKFQVAYQWLQFAE